jgi:hypothetical protein
MGGCKPSPSHRAVALVIAGSLLVILSEVELERMPAFAFAFVIPLSHAPREF